MNNQDELIAQARAMIKIGEKVLETETTAGQAKSHVHETQFHDFRISSLSYLSRVFGEGGTHYPSFKAEVTHPTASRTKRGIGILSATIRDLEGDWLTTTRGAIAEDTLKDMLRLAKIQLDQGSSGAAIIIAGAVLEKQLRNLCLAQGIAILNEAQDKALPKKGLQLTSDAYKKKIYDRKENKSVIEWLELSSSAAEGKFKSITIEQARNMLRGVTNFLNNTKY